MKLAYLTVALPFTLLAVAACAGSTASSDEANASAKRVPEVLELVCSDASGLKVDVQRYTASNFHVLVTPAGASASVAKLFCFSSVSAIGVCGDGSEGWRVSVNAKADGYAVSATPTNGATTTLACAPPPRPNPDTPIPTFADVAPILKPACASCHGDEFSTVEKVKRLYDPVLAMVASGAMPPDPEWKDTEYGQKLLDFLRHSPELR